VTGRCSDFNRGKGPVLRGLAARAPYFHNGSAANLQELVNFYDRRFNMQLTEEQKSDLVAFLNSPEVHRRWWRRPSDVATRYRSPIS